jgi:hypothetical protein
MNPSQDISLHSVSNQFLHINIYPHLQFNLTSDQVFQTLRLMKKAEWEEFSQEEKDTRIIFNPPEYNIIFKHCFSINFLNQNQWNQLMGIFAEYIKWCADYQEDHLSEFNHIIQPSSEDFTKPF